MRFKEKPRKMGQCYKGLSWGEAETVKGEKNAEGEPLDPSAAPSSFPGLKQDMILS